MTRKEDVPLSTRWARLRFAVVSPLLASPPKPGELQRRLEELAAKEYAHPETGAPKRFGKSTIEHWFYTARYEADPLGALTRKAHAQAGQHPSVSIAQGAAIKLQYQQHPSWSYKLHSDNLEALAKEDDSLGEFPGYATVRRYMKSRGFYRQRRIKRKLDRGENGVPVQIVHERREVRSYEVTHVHGLWHLDFHVGSMPVLTPAGEWKMPHLLGVLDDHSRLCCHLQWYLDETTDALVHGFCQALQKRALPWKLLTDNGAAMLAAEFTEGLARLSIVHETTLPYTPEQNAKQEVFWAQVEGRLMAMLEGEKELTLALLNEATQAWVELEYHLKPHAELDEAPRVRYQHAPNVGRPCPDSETLRRAFRMQVTRKQRRSDGTITVRGVRFEVPARYRVLEKLCLRYARWDLSSIDLVDPLSGVHLARILPLDKARNADGKRRIIKDIDDPMPMTPSPDSGIAPALRALMRDYAATGLPPAYLPKDDYRGGDDLAALREVTQ
jgi:transposase InsO family protein